MDKIITWGMGLILIAVLAQGALAVHSLKSGIIDTVVTQLVAQRGGGK